MVLMNTERILRECDCPPWVVRCAHTDGQMLVIIDDGPTGMPPCPTCEVDGDDLGTFFVQLLAGEWVNCPDCGVQAIWPHQTLARYASGASYPEALTAFHEAEEALLKSGVRD